MSNYDSEYHRIPDGGVYTVVEIPAAAGHYAPVHHRLRHLKVKVRTCLSCSNISVCHSIYLVAAVCFMPCWFKLLFAGGCLEEGWRRLYRSLLGSCKFSRRPRRLLSAAGWPHQNPPLPGCSLVRRERRHIRFGSQAHRGNSEQGSGTTEGAGDSGRERLRAWLESKRQMC